MIFKTCLTVPELQNLNIQFPSCQRDQIKEHIDELVEYQKTYYNKHGYYCYLGCLTLCLFKGKYYCIDGQHRYLSLLELPTPDNFSVWIEVIECTKKEEIIEYFKVINMNNPLPDFIRFIDEPILILKEYIKKTYASYIRHTQNPRRPCINIDIFLEEIHKLYGTQFKTDNIVNWFENENSIHGRFLLSREDDIVIKDIEKIRTMEQDGPAFYLGCFWLKPISSKISKVLTKKVWYKYYKDLSAKCPCCDINKIQIDEFDCGHIISWKNGGETKLDNLRPICRSCNQSMGSQNWDIFMSKI